MYSPSSRFLSGVILFILFKVIAAQQDSTCSVAVPCKSGCCSSSGKCGFGPEFCDKPGCQGNCDAKAECGQYALEENFNCPLNVCCSKWGFCGFDELFCNSECQNKGGCLPVVRPGCSESTDAMSAEVRTAYYGAWSAGRSCNALEPESIPAGVLTHINVAFEYVSAEHEITDMVGPVVGRTSRLKNIYSGLRVNIAIGGWTFNDPPTATRFSDMASTVSTRQTFIKSLIKYMKKYALDGVDIDWEYPVADDRGGIAQDFDNFVLLCSNIRDAFDSYDAGWQLTITLPNSYWYLRGFDIKRLEEYVDWFNVMTYDIHGIWDQKNIWTGPYLKGHTNLVEIETGLDLLWRNGITADKVVMGYGFYGRGFTMTDSNCHEPPDCTFDGPGYAGDCTNEPGILSYSEVSGYKNELGSVTFYDEETSVKYMVYGGNQWISWDDAESFNAKKKFMFKRCLKGLMIWELGLDSAGYGALRALFGDDAVDKGLSDTTLNPEEQAQLAFDLSAYTGQNCYVTQSCTKGGSDNAPDKICGSPEYSSVAVSHNPVQMLTSRYALPCKEGEYHHICCPTKAKPKNCEWLGAPERSAFGCNRGCGPSQFELTTDTFYDQFGEKNCFSGSRSLCCDSTDILRKCHWTDCGFETSANGNCADNEVTVATRMDSETGETCKSQTGLGNGGSTGPETHQWFRSYCCPKDDALEDCEWSNDPSRFPGASVIAAPVCVTKECPKDTLAITDALLPETLFNLKKENNDPCFSFVNYPGTTPGFPLCCAPPSRFTHDWPVNPAYLWSGAWTGDDDDVSWEWADNFGSNNADTHPDNLETDPGDDPYGFVMLDGPPGSIAKQFNKQFTILTRDAPTVFKPKTYVTTNQTILDATFEHTEETVHVYCNYAHDSRECNEIFHKGARDTIIKLPEHVGEGPWARVVSMEPDYDPPSLPAWAIRKREDTTNNNGIYRLTFDYNFHLIERADTEPVYMRVDYTNLQQYWSEVTDEPIASKAKHKRSAKSNLDFRSWKSRVERAKNGPITGGEDHMHDFHATGETDFGPDGEVPPSPYSSISKNHRRWAGTFLDWLKKITTITKQEAGKLPMGISKLFNIYSGRLRCTNDAGVTITAGLDITADVRLDMGAKYAYYFSGTVLPPKIIDTYVYVGAQPNVYAGVTFRGNAYLGYKSEVRKLVETISYPGLSIKGIATVGPTLDVWGQIQGDITISGQLKVGARYTFDQIDLYLPNNDETKDKASDQLKELQKDQTGLSPVFQADVRADVGVHLRVTPEINVGIKVGGGIGPLISQPFLDAHVSAFTNTSLHFQAHVTAGTTGAKSNWEYGYSIELLWRVGIAAVVQIYNYKEWRTNTYYPVDWQTIPIYGPIVVKSATTAGARRALALDAAESESWILSEEALPNPVFGWASMRPYDAPPDTNSIYNTSTTDIGLPLFKRQQSTTEREFKLGDFKCTTGGSSACDTDSLDQRSLSNMMPVTGRRNGRSRVVKISKRAGSDCRLKIPRIYFNCGTFFGDVALTGANGQVTLPGICSSARAYLFNNGIITNQIKLTFDPNNRGTRNSQSCGGARNICSAGGENNLRKMQLGAPYDNIRTLVNCDEFPFASTEEGGYGWAGNDRGLAPTNPVGTTRTCVPEWQNSLQGNCVSLLGNIESNVEYFNNAAMANDDPNAANWQSWDSNNAGWNRKEAFATAGKGRQRLSRYLTDQPVPLSGQDADEKADRSLSWYHKRNFTMYLVNNDGHIAAAFPGHTSATGTLVSNTGAQNTNLNDATWIICAISLRGQQRYRWGPNKDGSVKHNGYCWDGVTTRPVWGGVGNFVVIWYFSCDIDFDGAPHQKRGEKPGPIGFYGGEPIYGIKRVEDGDWKRVLINPEDAPLPDLRESFPLST